MGMFSDDICEGGGRGCVRGRGRGGGKSMCVSLSALNQQSLSCCSAHADPTSIAKIVNFNRKINPTLSQLPECPCLNPPVTHHYLNPSVTHHYLNSPVTHHYLNPPVTHHYLKPSVTHHYLNPPVTHHYLNPQWLTTILTLSAAVSCVRTVILPRTNASVPVLTNGENL